MDTLNIPKEHFESFEFYIKLPNELKEKLISEIQQTEIGLTPDTLISRLSKVIPLSKGRIKEIISIIFSLLRTRDNLKSDNEHFSLLLKNAFMEFCNEKKISLDVLIDEIMKLVSVLGNKLSITIEIIDLVTSNQRIYTDASINNDIRPVFAKKTNNFEGAVIIHNLKIEYRENDETKEMYFTLDTDDLQKLKNVIEIAENQLKVVKSATNINFIDIK